MSSFHRLALSVLGLLYKKEYFIGSKFQLAGLLWEISVTGDWKVVVFQESEGGGGGGRVRSLHVFNQNSHVDTGELYSCFRNVCGMR